MDDDRFDSLTRSVTVAGSRRRALASALGGALGLLGLTDRNDAAAARSGKCKQPCGECEQCQRGDCQRKNGKKRCRPGICTPTANGTACGSGGVCQGGTCVCASGTEPCDGACVPTCGSGETRNPVTCGCCQTNFQSCTPAGNNPACCSALCASGVCTGLAGNDPCQFDAQCKSGVCAGNGQCTISGK
jgi:hypothetical protein